MSGFFTLGAEALTGNIANLLKNNLKLEFPGLGTNFASIDFIFLARKSRRQPQVKVKALLMIKGMGKSLVAAAALFAFSMGAQASLIYTYQFGSETNAATLTEASVEAGGPLLTVTAMKNATTAGIINAANSGWGVDGAPGGGRLDNGEILSFDWGQAVYLLNGLFLERGAGTLETFDLVIDGVVELDDFVIGNSIDGNQTVFVDFTDVTPVNDFKGSIFEIVGGAGGGIRVQQLQIAVPEPSSVLLLALGLIGMAFRGRALQR